MKKLVLFFSLISLSLVTLTASAAEQCPTTGALQSIFAQSNPLPSGGKMPYPVNMDDPVYQPDDQTWFVVTHIETSDRGDPAKYIAFAVFKDPNPASPMSNAAAIVEAKSMVDASATKVSSAVDYKNFFMGTQGGRDYYFDVCMYAGSMDKPPGATGTTQQDMVAPMVMADLSPDTTPNALNAEVMSLVHQVRKAEAAQKAASLR